MTYSIFPGLKRNYLTVKNFEGKSSRGKKLWKCSCLCGGETVIETNALMSTIKPTKTCGRCEWHINHKDSYISWMAMKQRCNDETRKDYKHYGGRGISYTPKWESFIEFWIDMGDPPCSAITGERLSLDRKKVNENYSKDNCQWSTRSEQQLNKTNTRASRKLEAERN